MASVSAAPGEGRDDRAAAWRVADYLLGQQNADGAIPDVCGGPLCNEDSNTEYALIGLAAAYWASHDHRYLDGVEKGIRWLADREEMADPQWRGSWFYAFQSKPPYAPVPTSPGKGVTDVRGVDSTCALFPYLLHLHAALSGQDRLNRQYETNARAALDFALTRNQTPESGSFSSWQLKKRDGQWRLWRFQYTADQADVYLGLRAGGLLFGEERYRLAADRLRQRMPGFFEAKLGRYALGQDADGSLEPDFDGFDGIFPQGYLPWVLGNFASNSASCQWLSQRVQSDGSLSCYPKDPKYTLSAAVYVMAARALGQPVPVRSLDWIMTQATDPAAGGVRDTAAPKSEKFSNVAGFTIVALTGFPAFP